VLQHTLRETQLAGHDIGNLIDWITAALMDGARLIASVLHGRLQRLKAVSVSDREFPGLTGSSGTERARGKADCQLGNWTDPAR
jgi:hypothetical protein